MSDNAALCSTLSLRSSYPKSVEDSRMIKPGQLPVLFNCRPAWERPSDILKSRQLPSPHIATAKRERGRLSPRRRRGGVLPLRRCSRLIILPMLGGLAVFRSPSAAEPREAVTCPFLPRAGKASPASLRQSGHSVGNFKVASAATLPKARSFPTPHIESSDRCPMI